MIESTRPSWCKPALARMEAGNIYHDHEEYG